jgi:sentrin-specific protease 1
MDKVLIPVHFNKNHWTLAVIDFKKKQFQYYDSLGGRNPDLLEMLAQYVRDEAEIYSQQPKYSTDEWERVTPSAIPHQNNGSDCGVFVCKYADYISQDLALDFSYNDIPYFRKRMALDIERLKVN